MLVTGTRTLRESSGGFLYYPLVPLKLNHDWLSPSGAIFLAVSEEKGLDYNHDIIYNGYNLGRDWFVGNATNQDSLIPTVLETVNGTWYSGVTNQTTYSGDKTFNNYTYHTDVQYVSGLLPNSSGES